jgi:hypothetical protein
VLHTPDGAEIPTVVTVTELQALVGRLSELTARAQSPGTAINLNEVFRAVLGRDPLSERE